jgi:hypothetical protein
MTAFSLAIPATLNVCNWHIAKFFRNAKLGRYRGTADIDQASLIEL